MQQLLHEDRGSVSAEQLVDRRSAPELSIVPGYSCSVGLYGSIFTIPVYTSRKKDPNDILISSFRGNLHWSTHSTNGNAIMTPVDMTPAFPACEQLAHVAWVYDYAMEIEPVMRRQRFDAAFRTTPGAATICQMNCVYPRSPNLCRRGYRKELRVSTLSSELSKSRGPSPWLLFHL